MAVHEGKLRDENMLAFFLTSTAGRALLAGTAFLAVVGVEQFRIHIAQHGQKTAEAQAASARQAQLQCAASLKAVADAGNAAKARAASDLKAVAPVVKKARQGAQRLSQFVPVGASECERVESAVTAVRESLP